MSADEFYIGWQDKEQRGYRKMFFRFFGIAFAIMIGVALLYLGEERGHVDSYFDFGHLTEIEGRLVLEPIPALITVEDGKRKTVPLVGFGKFGADAVLIDLQDQLEKDLSTYEAVVRGTIFTYQDKLWMELTEGSESIVSYREGAPLTREIATIGQMEFTGEVVDPKCFFGVMNPATKAVHRSCAIRCIAGGVPPILGLRRDGVFVDYYFLKDNDLEAIHQQVLPYVGIPITVTGEVVVYDDWKVLMINPQELTISSAKTATSSISMCL